MDEVRLSGPSDSWVEAGLAVPGLEAGLEQVEDSLVEVGRELVEVTLLRVSILEEVSILELEVSTLELEVSTQVEVSTLALEVSTQEDQEEFHPRASILVEEPHPRVNIPEEEVEVPLPRLPPAPAQLVSQSLTSPPHLRVPLGPAPATQRTAVRGNIIPSDTTTTAPWLRSKRGLTTTVSIPSGW